MDEYYIREPLGVFGLLPPFNFPAMIALYFTWPIACGNTVVVKPSELCPMTMLRITELRLGDGKDPNTNIGPVVSKRSLESLYESVGIALKQGAKIIIDGRNPQVNEHPEGFFFGPVRRLKSVSSLQEAINIINASSYGHAAVIYTQNGGWAHHFIRSVNTGQVGINVGKPAPIAYCPVGGRKLSFFGSHRGRANDAIDSYTDKKVVVTKWNNYGENEKTDQSSQKIEPNSVLF